MDREKFKNSKSFSFLLFLAVLFVGYHTFSLVRETVFLSDESRAAEREIAELQHEKKRLEAAIAEFDNPSVIERKAKELLNLKLPGEKVLVVPEKIRSEEGNVAETPSLLQKLRDMLFFSKAQNSNDQ